MRRTLLALMIALGAPAPAFAQAIPDTLVALPDSTAGPSPRSAMFRSMLLPGWGQIATGAERRAAVFFGVHATNVYMSLETLSRIRDTEDRESAAVAFAGDSILTATESDSALHAMLVANPDSLAVRVDASGRVDHVRRLLDARKQQREDWLAWTLFWMMASGADAYVNAHLSDFPAQLLAEPRAGGGMRMGLHVPLRRRR